MPKQLSTNQAVNEERNIELDSEIEEQNEIERRQEEEQNNDGEGQEYIEEHNENFKLQNRFDEIFHNELDEELIRGMQESEMHESFDDEFEKMEPVYQQGIE